MKFYRFVVGDIGIYEAVERDCPRDDKRREGKPDGSWLPRVGKSYPGAISFWKERGLKKYLESGLQQWHRSVVSGEVSVLVAEALSDIVYEDEYQVIAVATSVKLRAVAWEDLWRSLSQ